MADKTDDLIISISTDTATIRRSLKRLEGDIASVSGNVVKKFDAMGKGIDNSMTTAMQARINHMVGVGTKASKEWTGVLAQQGAELEKLRTKYNPVFAAIKQYQASVVSIQQAHRIGALSSDEMTSAIQRERKATLDNIAAIKQRNAAVTSMKPLQEGARGYQTANIAAQFQDIAVTSAMGMSPIQIALQQGTQLSAVFNEMGKGKAVLDGIKQAFLSIISPVSLVTIGVIAAGAALAQYIASAGDMKTADDILKQHEENINRLGPAYAEAIKEQQKYATESPAVVEIELRQDKKEALKAQAAEAGKAVANIFAATMSAENSTQVSEAFKPAEQAIAEFFASVREGQPKVAAFREEVGKLADSGKLSSDAAELLTKFTKAAYDNEVKLGSVSDTVDRYKLALGSLQDALGRISSEKARQELLTLMEKAKSGEKSAGDLQAAFDKLSGTYPDLSAARQELSDLITKFGEAQEAAAGFARTTAKGDLGWDLPKPLSAGDFDRRTSGQDPLKKQLEDQAKAFAPKKERKSQAERDANAYRDLVKSARDRIEQLKLEEQLIGNTGVAAETMRMKLELLQKAQDKGRAVSPAQQQEIAKLADEYGKAAEKVAALTLAEELRFEKEQLFRSPTEQRVYSTLRSAGIDPEGDYGQMIAGQIRLNEKLAEAKDLTLDFAQGFTQDLMNGVSATEALANAVGRLGQQLLDIALNQAINQLFGNLLGGGLFGGGGFQANTTLGNMIKGIPGFASGTNSAPGGLSLVGEKGPELVNLPRGAQVIPNDILRSMSNRSVSGPRVPSIPQAANSNGGRVAVDVGVSVDEKGNLLAYVKNIAEAESKKEVGRYDRGGAYRLKRDSREAKRRGIV